MNANRVAIGATNSVTNTSANVTAVVTNSNNSAVNTAVGNNVNVASNGVRITDVNYFAGINNKALLAGRTVNFQHVKVDRVLSDHVFTVKSGDSGEMFVYLDESQDSGGGREKQVKITFGQQLNLNGDFRQVPNAEIAIEKNEKQGGGLTDKEYGQMKGQQVYLHATRQ